jgi:transglutaminase-like putative cysteine protease
MHFAVRHITTCRYSTPVHLGPHILRLTLRSDGRPRLLEHACHVSPQPALRSSALDAEGNVVTRPWFTGLTEELHIQSDIRVETQQENPCDFIVDTPATSLPIPYNNYETSLLAACPVNATNHEPGQGFQSPFSLVLDETSSSSNESPVKPRTVRHK